MGEVHMRNLVVDSWERSVAAGVNAETTQVPFLFERTELLEQREQHALSTVFPLLFDVLGRAAEACESVMAIGDADGVLLWVCGDREIVRKAESIRFVEGSQWDETSVGTNAPGTALRLDAAVQINASEHFVIENKKWSCASAPIHDPLTSRVIGVVDVTGGKEVESPQTLAMTRAAARMAEAELGRLMMVQGIRHGGLVVPSPIQSVLRLTALGRPDCQVETANGTLRLSRRHSDIVSVLADNPEGMSGEQLALAVYEYDIQPSTLRAEMVRLRSILGPDALESRPYRLCAETRSDWIDVAKAVEEHRLRDAVMLYRGPLLPNSQAPGVNEQRDRLERQLRSAILASNDPDLLTAWTRSRWGCEDLEMWEYLLRVLPASSPLRSRAIGEVQRLRIEFGIPQLKTSRDFRLRSV